MDHTSLQIVLFLLVACCSFGAVVNASPAPAVALRATKFAECALDLNSRLGREYDLKNSKGRTLTEVSLGIAALVSDNVVATWCSATHNPAVIDVILEKGAPDTARIRSSVSAKANASSTRPQPEQLPTDPLAPPFNTPPLTPDNRGLYTTPAQAEYFSGSSTAGVFISGAVAIPNLVPSYNQRADTQAEAAFAISLQTAQSVLFAAEQICDAGDTVGTWEGVGVGSWQAPAEIACLIALIAAQTTAFGLEQIKTELDFFDSYISGVREDATFINVAAGLANDGSIWDKIQTEAQLTRQTVVTQGELTRETVVTQAELTRAAVEAAKLAILAAIADLKQFLDVRTCQLKVDLAAAQRDLNTIRALAVTPQYKLPKWEGKHNKELVFAAECPFVTPRFTYAPTCPPVSSLFAPPCVN